MLVYGDAVRRVEAGALRAAVAEALDRAGALPPGLGRHAALAAALVEAGGLAQGIADAAFARDGHDADPPGVRAVHAVLARLAAALWRSWEGGFAAPEAGEWDMLRAAVRALSPEQGELAVRLPEGFGFYAVYPEGFAAAAAASNLGPATRVIGIRSIGAPLGAMVAAGLGAPPPVTVRPVGHPFRRTLRLSPDLTARLGGPGCAAVVDEGPGLSGSSFGAAIDALAGAGVPEVRLALFPSHAGAPGPEADPAHAARWPRLARHVTDFDDLILRAPRPVHRLDGWVAGLLGEARVTLEDVSGGAWRPHRCADPRAWPPAHPAMERRKFRVGAASGPWLARFAGLGAEGERKLAMARVLAGAGWAPRVAGLAHGFLVERWEEGAEQPDPSRWPADRLAGEVGRYLGLRAAALPMAAGRGASLEALATMARRNTGLALGPEAARALDRWTPERLAPLQRDAVPVATDGRLHLWEWSALPGGRLVKHDALDHHAAHDLVGCQDIAWDVAGAGVELGLDRAGEARLCAIIEAASGRPVVPALLAFLRPCYLAFQLGLWTLAREGASDPADAARSGALAARYARHLAGELAAA